MTGPFRQSQVSFTDSSLAYTIFLIFRTTTCLFIFKTLEENLVRLDSQEAGRIAELEINLINLPLQEK